MRRRRFPAAVLWLAAAATAWALLVGARPAGAMWCIVRSGAPDKAVKKALDYACSPAGGADCAPIQSSGLCFLPNTLAAHASYAFNSIFQRSGAAPGACDFAGTATTTLTDPSYGSCTYPASPSTAGSAGSRTPRTLSPPGSNNNRQPDLGPDDSNGGRALVAATSNFLTTLAASSSFFLVYFLHRWWWWW